MRIHYTATTSILIILCMLMPAFAVITVEQINGTAAYKVGKEWKPLTVNQKLEVGTKISTAAGSSVVLDINGNKLTIRQLSM
ncbi:MAG: hypothetical protein N2316_10485, partial [Spirochaetes bacterium]|nr:hypothetical protein [Spirochaetota bacterium]